MLAAALLSLLPSWCVICDREVRTPEEVYDYDAHEGWVTCRRCSV